MSTEDEVYIFDVDGVLSDVFVDKIDLEIISLIAQKVEVETKVAFNTGRTSAYVLRNVLAPLSAMLVHESSLENVVIVSEMGGEQTTFSQGAPTTARTKFSMKSEDIQLAERIFDRGGYRTIKFEHDKSTMVSNSIKKGSKLSEFILERDNLHESLSKAFKGKPVEVITTVGSVDMYESGAGKRGGAKIVSEWLQTHTDVTQDKYVCFGDSPSDYTMAEYFAEQGMNVSFVFTGAVEHLPKQKASVPIIKCKKLYTAATKEYLKKSF